MYSDDSIDYGFTEDTLYFHHQAQLIAILRAIYKNSPILVLDEPTGSLYIF